MQQQWQAMTPEERQQIGQQIPQLNERMHRFAEEGAAGQESGTITGTQGRTHEFKGKGKRDGNLVTTEKTITGANGQSAHLTSATSVADNKVTTVTTTESGKTFTSEVTGSPAAGGLHTSTTVTGPQGEVAVASGDWMFDFLEESDY
ncbi:MAG TPA: hypothetical protein PLM07_17265 [Candidatus Rifleibacterium sp.]|nr:hypothetical protein [Candidatus Rifleibacterium sp.]HPT47631.1 hypothetical protein [Candidatus Rifleibacterium sp.]